MRSNLSPVVQSSLFGCFALTVLFIADHGHCISLKNIEPLRGTFQDTTVITLLRQTETETLENRQSISTDRTRDTTAAFMLRLYHTWRSGTADKANLKSDLVTGLLLLRLGDLGLKWPFDTAKTLLAKTARKFPQSRIVAWMQGLRDIQSGEITKGIRVLDSLHVSGFNDATFLRDYAVGVARALIPARGAAQSIFIGDRSDMVSDTFGPVSYEWRVMRPDVQKGRPKLPCYTYGATFELRKPFHLVFAGLKPKYVPEVNLVSMPDPRAAADFMDQLAWRTEIAHCKLFIDVNKSKRPLSEQLSRRIKGCYDSISIRSDMTKSRGISLRCYTVPRYVDEDEKYTAIVTFDRPLPDMRQSTGLKNPRKEIMTVRYTLVVQSSSDVKDILEVKLQSILRAFL